MFEAVIRTCIILLIPNVPQVPDCGINRNVVGYFLDNQTCVEVAKRRVLESEVNWYKKYGGLNAVATFSYSCLVTTH
jgi:hypothetical protein